MKTLLLVTALLATQGALASTYKCMLQSYPSGIAESQELSTQSEDEASLAPRGEALMGWARISSENQTAGVSGYCLKSNWIAGCYEAETLEGEVLQCSKANEGTKIVSK